MLELRGHTGPVLGLAFSPDGKTLASASADGSVRLWDVRTGALQETLQCGESRAHCVAFSQSGKRLAAGFGGERGMVQIWDCRTSRRIESWAAHERATRGVAFGVDRNSLITCGDRPSLVVWNLPGAEHQHSVTYAGGPNAIAIRRGHHEFATIRAAPARVQFWELSRVLNSRRFVSLHGESAYSIDYSSSACLVACGTEGSVVLATSERQAPAPLSWHAHDGAVLGIRFLANGKSVLSAATDGLVCHWTLSGERIQSLDWQIGELGAIAVAPDGLTAAVGGAETIVIWDLEL